VPSSPLTVDLEIVRYKLVRQGGREDQRYAMRPIPSWVRDKLKFGHYTGAVPSMRERAYHKMKMVRTES
jgi:hypothetical protein